MLRRATARFRRLNALSASTNKTASVPAEANTFLSACIAASQPDRWPAHTCVDPAALVISLLSTDTRDLPIIRFKTSPIPTGRTPGFFEMGIKRLFRSGLSPTGSTSYNAMCLATSATASHKSFDADLKDTIIRLHI